MPNIHRRKRSAEVGSAGRRRITIRAYNSRRYAQRSGNDQLTIQVNNDQKHDWVQIIATGLPGLAAMFALIFTYLSLQQANAGLQTTRDQLTLNEQEQITDKLNSDVADLASANGVIQLEGIYALKGLMEDYPSYQPAVIGVLCAYIRDNAPVHMSRTSSRLITTSPQLSPDIQAALTVLATRNADRDGRAVIDLDDSNLGGAQLTGADLSRAALAGTDMEDAALNGVNLAGANLSQTDMANADLTNVNMTNTNLTGADLASGILISANLTDAELSGANLDHVDDVMLGNLVFVPPAADLAIGTGPGGFTRYFSIGDLRKVSPQFNGAVLSEATLVDANLIGSQMSNVELNKANLSGAGLAYTTLMGSDLSYANLSGADLAYANLASPVPGNQFYTTNLAHANLKDANLSDSNLTDVQLTDANVTGVNIKGATLTGVRRYFASR